MGIQLLGAEWEPRLPNSFVQRQEILLSIEQGVDPTHQLRVWGAALGATWNHPDRSKTLETTMESCGYSVRLYGEHVANELIRAGVSPGEIVLQGSIAYTKIAGSIITQPEIEKRAGFSSAAPASGRAAAEEVETA